MRMGLRKTDRMGLIKSGLVLLVTPVLLAAALYWAESFPALASLRLALGVVLYFLGFASMVIGGLMVIGGTVRLLWQRRVLRKNG